MSLQPASFTDPPLAPDRPESLPRRCPECGGYLSRKRWIARDDLIDDGDGRYAHFITSWEQPCAKCGCVVRR